MAMGGGGSTYRSADGIWHAAIDIEPDRATGRKEAAHGPRQDQGGGEREAQDEAGRIRAQRRNPAKMVRPVSASSSSLKVNPPSLPDDG